MTSIDSKRNEKNPLPSSKELEEVAQRAASEGAVVLQNYYESGIAVNFKGEVDLVTQADVESQEAVVNVLRKAFPTHSILAEDASEGHGQTLEGPIWIIDPLDGTTNFSHGFGIFGISMVFRDENETRFALTHYPLRDEVFTAHRGYGAMCNGKKIEVSKINDLNRSLLSTGFPYDRRQTNLNNVNVFSYFELQAQCVRRGGAATIDLAHVAAGRFEGFWEPGLKPWDIAAGILLVEEAGGKVTDYSGRPIENLWSKEIVASNGLIHEELLEGIALAQKTVINRELFLSNA